MIRMGMYIISFLVKYEEERIQNKAREKISLHKDFFVSPPLKKKKEKRGRPGQWSAKEREVRRHRQSG